MKESSENQPPLRQQARRMQEKDRKDEKSVSDNLPESWSQLWSDFASVLIRFSGQWYLILVIKFPSINGTI